MMGTIQFTIGAEPYDAACLLELAREHVLRRCREAIAGL